MSDKVREDFLKDVSATAQRMYVTSLTKIEENFTQQLPSTGKSLETSILCGLEKFESLRCENLVGELNYIYISFLRTSIITDNENYRIDFYDKKNRLSLVECVAKWNFDYTFNYYREIKIALEKQFSRQTKVPAYELDEILYDLADLYQKKGREKIYFVLGHILQENGHEMLGDKSVKFYRGEFLDKIRFLLQWKNGIMHTNEKEEL